MAELTFTCSKSIIETLEKDMKWNVQTFRCFYFEHISHLFSSVSIVDFKQVNVSRRDFLHANKYLLKNSNKNTGKRCEIYSKLTKSPGQRQWGLSGVFIVNFEHMLHLFLSVSIVDFEQVNVCCVIVSLLKYCKMVWKDFNPVFLTVGESRDQRV